MTGCLALTLRAVLVLVFVLAGVGGHSNMAAAAATKCPHHTENAAAGTWQHGPMPCGDQGAGIDSGACCVAGLCLLGILLPKSLPLPQPEPPQPGALPTPALTDVGPALPWRPPA
jgi:hypothetical protein